MLALDSLTPTETWMLFREILPVCYLNPMQWVDDSRDSPSSVALSFADVDDSASLDHQHNAESTFSDSQPPSAPQSLFGSDAEHHDDASSLASSSDDDGSDPTFFLPVQSKTPQAVFEAPTLGLPSRKLQKGVLKSKYTTHQCLQAPKSRTGRRSTRSLKSQRAKPAKFVQKHLSEVSSNYKLLQLTLETTRI